MEFVGVGRAAVPPAVSGRSVRSRLRRRRRRRPAPGARGTSRRRPCRSPSRSPPAFGDRASSRSATPSLATTASACASQAPASMPASTWAGGRVAFIAAASRRTSAPPPSSVCARARGWRQALRRIRAGDVAHRQEASRDVGIGRDLAHVRRNPRPQGLWHLLGREQAMTAEDGQRRKTRFRRRRHVGGERCAFVAGDGDKPEFAGLGRPDQRRERQEGKVDAALGEIGQGGEGIAVGDVGELQPGGFQEGGEGEVGYAGRAGPGEGAGLGRGPSRRCLPASPRRDGARRRAR